MATNRFFDNTGLSVVSGSIAKASQVNSVTNETNKGFDLVAAELNNINVGAILSYEWANNDQGDEPDGTNLPGEYSSRANAEESYGWAAADAGTQTEADGFTIIPQSAKGFQGLAATSETNAYNSMIAAQLAQDLAQEFAANPYGVPVSGYPGYYSSLHYSVASREAANDSATSAGESEASNLDSQAARDTSYHWAQYPEDSPVPEGNGSEFSAYHWKQKAEEIVNATGLGDLNVTHPITVDKTIPSIPLIGWDGDKTDVGLDEVDNTSDQDKPISDATQAALDTLASGKVSSVTGSDPIIVSGTSQNPVVSWGGDKTDVGLGNVDNTSDEDKPVSDATQTALDLKEDHLGVPGGDGYILESTAAGIRSWRIPPFEVPTGGLTDQVLGKLSDTPYDYDWIDQSGGGSTGGGGLEWVAPQTGVDPVIAASGKGYPLIEGQTLQLPALPSDNDQIGWKDFNNDFDQVPCFIDPQGNNIEDLGSAVMELNTRGQGGTLVWMTDRWMITDVTELGDREPEMYGIKVVYHLDGIIGASTVEDITIPSVVLDKTFIIQNHGTGNTGGGANWNTQLINTTTVRVTNNTNDGDFRYAVEVVESY